MRQLERIFSAEGTVSGLTEAQLLDRFATTHDDAAFEAIVRRHGRAVLAVCRRLLHDPHEAEDAFQATFLVLARRAGSISRSRPIGPWLVGVAYRIASKARVASARRRRRESVVAGRRVEAVDAPAPITIDLGPVLWEELNRLPHKYREPVVLCWVEGHSHDEAADLLRWPVGTVKGRLHRAKETLRTRLSNRGITAPAAGLSAWFSSEAAAAIVPPPLLGSTLKSAVLIASGASLLAGTVPAGVALLARGALQTMFLTKLSIATASVALVGTSLVGGLGFLAGSTGEGTSAPDPQQGSIGVVPQVSGGAESSSEQDATAKGTDSQDQPPAETGFLGDPFAARHRKVMEELEAGRMLEDLQRQRVEAARKRLVAQEAFFEAGTINIDRYLDAARALLDARLAVSSTPDNLRSAINEYRGIVESIAIREAKKLEDGLTSDADVSEARLALAEAEVLLAQALEPTPDDDPSPVRSTGTMPSTGVRPGPGMSGDGPSDEPPSRPNSGGDGPGRANDPASKAILAKLDLPISMPFDHETPLSELLEYVRQATADENLVNGIPIYVDEFRLQESEQSPQSPVQMNIEGIPLKTTLWLTLRQLDLAYSVIDGVLIISSRNLLDDMLKEDPIFEGRPEPEPGRRGLGFP
jgi:RNA polymerase sigma factor (sigma-70 family)